MISKKSINLYLKISIAVIILGILFKILHYSFAVFFFLTGALGIIIFYSLRFALKRPKKLLDYSKLFLVTTFIIQYVLRVFHRSFGGIFSLLAQIALVIFMVLLVRDVFFVKDQSEKFDHETNPNKSFKKGLNYLLYAIAAIGIIVGASVKILHWQFGFINGNVLLTIGLLAAALSVIRGLGDS